MKTKAKLTAERTTNPAKKSTKKITASVSIRRGSGDLVNIQVVAELYRVPKGIKITQQMLAEAIRRKAAGSTGKWNPKTKRTDGAHAGDDPPGIRLKIKQWRNPERKKDKRGWRDEGSQAQRWGSLRQAFQRASIHLNMGKVR